MTTKDKKKKNAGTKKKEESLPVSKKQVHSVAKKAILKSIDLVTVNAMRIDSVSEPTESQAIIETKVRHRFAIEDDKYYLFSRPLFVAKGAAKDFNGEIVPYEIVMEFEVRYVIPNSDELTKEDCAQFAMYNGTYNAWPFFREFAKTIGDKMGICNLMVPLLVFSPSLRGMSAIEKKEEQ